MYSGCVILISIRNKRTNGKNSDFDHRRKSQEQEISSEIMKLVKGEKDPASFPDEGALPLKLKHLVALGAAIAS